MATINVNGQQRDVSDVPPATPLLWVLRAHLGLTGTKYGCGVSECGACTIHVDGEAVQSCVTAISDIGEGKIVTIEGLSANGDHPVQQAWKEHNVPQCGYCQVGQMMTCAAMLAHVYRQMCIDMGNGMRMDICSDMCTDMCMDVGAES